MDFVSGCGYCFRSLFRLVGAYSSANFSIGIVSSEASGGKKYLQGRKDKKGCARRQKKNLRIRAFGRFFFQTTPDTYMRHHFHTNIHTNVHTNIHIKKNIHTYIRTHTYNFTNPQIKSKKRSGEISKNDNTRKTTKMRRRTDKLTQTCTFKKIKTRCRETQKMSAASRKNCVFRNMGENAGHRWVFFFV